MGPGAERQYRQAGQSRRDPAYGGPAVAPRVAPTLGPDPASHLEHALQLAELLVDGHPRRTRPDARREPALRGDRELLQGEVLAGLLDAPREVVHRLQLRLLRADQAEHRDLALRHES